MPLAKDLLHPLPSEESRRHKLKRLVQHPNSYFMDVKCPGCYRWILMMIGSNKVWFLLNICKLQDHHCLQQRPDCCRLRRMLKRAVPAHWRPGQVRKDMKTRPATDTLLLGIVG